MVIRRPLASTRLLKSPFFIAAVGTVLNCAAGVPSRYLSPLNMKNVLLLPLYRPGMITGPSISNPY